MKKLISDLIALLIMSGINRALFSRIFHSPIFWGIAIVFVGILTLGHVRESIFKDPHQFLEGLVVEVYGALFDIAVMSVFVLWITRRGSERQIVCDLQDDISDFSAESSPDALFYKVSRIKRLNRRGITNIDLTSATLRGMDLSRMNLNGAYLQGADLSGCKLVKTFFWDADLRDADLSNTDMTDASFQNADLRGAKLNIEQLVHVRSLHGAQIDEDLAVLLKAKNPNVFQQSYVWKVSHSKSVYHLHAR